MMLANPGRLYKNRDKAMISGVCAGIADYFSVCTGLVRWIFFILGVFNGFIMIIIYIAAALYLDPRPDDLYAGPAEEKFWKTFRHSPAAIVENVQSKFDRLDKRLQSLEAHVTSRKYQLDKKFKDL